MLENDAKIRKHGQETERWRIKFSSYIYLLIHEVPSISGLGQNGAHQEMQSFDPPPQRPLKDGPGAGALPFQIKSPWPVVGFSPCGRQSSHYNLNICAFVLFQHVIRQRPTPLPTLSPVGRGQGPPAAQDGCMQANGPDWLLGGPDSHGDQHPALQLTCLHLFSLQGKLIPFSA